MSNSKSWTAFRPGALEAALCDDAHLYPERAPVQPGNSVLAPIPCSQAKDRQLLKAP